MKAYFNGCSHTYGTDLQDPAKTAWPTLVATQLNCEFVNDSIVGGTNDRIKYRTIKFVNDFDCFYLAWTYTSRFTRYRVDNNFEVNFNPNLKNNLYSDAEEFQTYGKIHYQHWHNELYAFKLWLQDILMLQSFLKSKNKKVVMLNATNNLIDVWSVDWKNFNNSVKSLVCFDRMSDQQLKDEHIEIQNLISQIDQTCYIGWNNWWLTKLTEEYSTGPTGHLLEQGHAAAANFILNYDSN